MGVGRAVSMTTDTLTNFSGLGRKPTDRNRFTLGQHPAHSLALKMHSSTGRYNQERQQDADRVRCPPGQDPAASMDPCGAVSKVEHAAFQVLKSFERAAASESSTNA